jgi:hypothetical protein
MDTRELRAGLDELFGGDLAGVMRRLGERPIGAGPDAALDLAEAEARDQVWQVLWELGVPGLATAGLVEVFDSMGFALYHSPLLDTVIAAELAGKPFERGLRVALAVRESGLGTFELPPLQLGTQGVSATRRFVPFAADVDYLLLAGQTPDGIRLGLVPRDQPGVCVRRQDDITRGDLYAVTFTDASAEWLATDEAAYAEALGRARLLQAAYLTGLSRGALALTVHYVRQRSAFGQPIARFQHPAFRLAALEARIQAVAELVKQGAREPDPALTSLRALALAGDLARDAATEAVQLHGAYGMTEQCDAQRFYRCAALGAVWFGSPSALRSKLSAALV